MAGERLAADERLTGAPHGHTARGRERSQAAGPLPQVGSAAGVQLQHARQQGQPHASLFPMGGGGHPPQRGGVTTRDGIVDLSFPFPFIVSHEWRSSKPGSCARPAWAWRRAQGLHAPQGYACTAFRASPFFGAVGSWLPRSEAGDKPVAQAALQLRSYGLESEVGAGQIHAFGNVILDPVGVPPFLRVDLDAFKLHAEVNVVPSS